MISRNLLSTISYAGGTIDTRTYDAGGRLSTETLGNGQVVNRTYLTGDNLPLAISNSAVGDYTFAWDANKNKTSETIAGTMAPYSSTMAFDDQNRLTTWNRTNGDSQAWTLSAVNDWSSFTNNGTAVARTHGPTHEILTIGAATITHDSRGNMTTDEFAITRTYDWNNKVSQAVVPTGSVRGIVGTHDYQYDALGRRVRKTIGGSSPSDTVFVHLGEQIYADYTAGAAATSPDKKYVWGSYVDELVCQIKGTTKYYIHRNQQYSTTAITAQSGTPAERYGYTSYGDLRVLNPNTLGIRTTPPMTRYTYTGREFDHECGTYHFRARIYSATLGRFTGHDPILYPGGWNTYAGWFTDYRIDPSGMIPIWVRPEDGMMPPPPDPLPPQRGGLIDFLRDFIGGPCGMHGSICMVLAGKIEDQLQTAEERDAWRRFTRGDGLPHTINDPNIGSSFNSSELQEAINRASKVCMKDGTPPIDTIPGSFGKPYDGALGGVSVTLKFKCEGCCVSYQASINDPYNFDSRGIPGFTDRSTNAELKTLLVEAAQVASQCGWKEYNNRATWSGSGCYKMPTPLPSIFNHQWPFMFY